MINFNNILELLFYILIKSINNIKNYNEFQSNLLPNANASA